MERFNFTWNSKKEEGYAASFGWEKLIGQEAITETDLHPSGWVTVKDERFFAISEGNFINKNEVEKKGISLALGKSKEADLNIVVIDNSSKSINNEIKKMINKDTIVLLNKSDVQNKQNHKFDNLFMRGTSRPQIILLKS